MCIIYFWTTNRFKHGVYISLVLLDFQRMSSLLSRYFVVLLSHFLRLSLGQTNWSGAGWLVKSMFRLGHCPGLSNPLRDEITWRAHDDDDDDFLRAFCRRVGNILRYIILSLWTYRLLLTTSEEKKLLLGECFFPEPNRPNWCLATCQSDKWGCWPNPQDIRNRRKKNNKNNNRWRTQLWNLSDKKGLVCWPSTG